MAKELLPRLAAVTTRFGEGVAFAVRFLREEALHTPPKLQATVHVKRLPCGHAWACCQARGCARARVCGNPVRVSHRLFFEAVSQRARAPSVFGQARFWARCHGFSLPAHAPQPAGMANHAVQAPVDVGACGGVLTHLAERCLFCSLGRNPSNGNVSANTFLHFLTLEALPACLGLGCGGVRAGADARVHYIVHFPQAVGWW